jgi:hypothetical protein
MFGLIRLFERWAEREIVRTLGRGLSIPADTYAWVKDSLGNYHFGSYDAWGHFIQGQAGFDMERCTAPRENSRLDEFGCAFRKLAELDQGLIVVGHFGGLEEWLSFLVQKKLSSRLADKRLSGAWLRLIWECKRRDLLVQFR